jgi:ABC-type Fe3+-hydroxamate transport system substrate-binding protein
MNMKQVQDQTGKLLFLPVPPKRIISLVPSQTELLSDLGLEQKVAGITKFCIHPLQWYRTKQRVGGTKQLDIDLVKSLQPDLVIANKEENVKEQVEAISSFCPVYTSDISTLEGAFHMIQDIGYITDTHERAETIVHSITEKCAKTSIRPIGKALYLIWRNPCMAAGSDTFISDMMRLAGFDNILEQVRYPQLDETTLNNLQPDFIFLSSEPYPFKENHVAELKRICPLSKVVLVNGEYFSWYGSRLLQAADYFAELRESLFLENNELI